MNDVCVLIHDQLTSAEIDDYTAIVASRVPNANGQTGANRVDFAQVMIIQGILDKDSARIAAGRDALSAVFPLSRITRTEAIAHLADVFILLAFAALAVHYLRGGMETEGGAATRLETPTPRPAL